MAQTPVPKPSRSRWARPTAEELRLYRKLSGDVVLVIFGFVILGLLMALAANLLPALMAG